MDGPHGPRVVVAADAASKKGHGFAAGCGLLTQAGCVEGLHPTGETTHYDLCVAGAPSNHVRCASLRSRGNSACGAEDWGLPQSGNAYKISVTDSPICIIRHEKHYVDQPPPVAFPPFGALRHHLPPAERWDNKALKSSSFISSSQHNGAL